MGCSSSAPNTISANSSKEDKSIQFEEDTEETYSKHVETIDTASENRTEIKVLPRSGTTEKIQQLARNNKSTTSLEPEKDLHRIGKILESGHNVTSVITKTSKDEDKDDAIPKLKLEEVVGKFIEITQDTNHEKDAGDHNIKEATEFAEKDKDEMDAKLESKQNDDGHEHNLEEIEEVSPSQSESSRATRWEALADIAAELPPSLAVDPLTGQIYSLSK